MVVDSSAIVAVALLEPEWETVSKKALGAQTIVAAPTLLEAHMVLRSRLGKEAESALALVSSALRLQVVPFREEHYKEACTAFDCFGKGRHPAALNFGDCISYALSKVSGQPLLFVGADFSRTDVVGA